MPLQVSNKNYNLTCNYIRLEKVGEIIFNIGMLHDKFCFSVNANTCISSNSVS